MAGAELTVGLVQMRMDPEPERNRRRAVRMVREAAAQGARLVVLPELFEHRYFPAEARPEAFALATALQDNPALRALGDLAAERRIAVVASVFERCGPHLFNTAVVLDEGGRIAAVYRKSHLPTGPGYEERYYFRAGDRPPPVVRTAACALGVAVCWDQWFPEVARSLVLRGAECIAYPTAIGSEPADPAEDSRGPWRRVLAGHAVANAAVVAAANRTGDEGRVRFYGSSVLYDERGEVVAELGRDEEGIALGTVDLQRARRRRDDWGLLRDRRPELYGALLAAPEALPDGASGEAGLGGPIRSA